MLKGFAPIVSKTPKALIVGSMPSVVSLSKQEYYGYAQNRFWMILAAYYQADIQSYEAKCTIIRQHHLALWDVIAYCEREGSLDSAIRKVIPNDLHAFCQRYPKIQVILCNGSKAAQLLHQHFPDLPLKVIKLPSTSNANRTIKETQLYEAWFDALKQIEQ